MIDTIDRELLTATMAEIRQRAAYDHVAIVVPADPGLDAATVLQALPAGERSLWWQPDAETVVVGGGTAVAVRAAPTDPLEQAARFASLPLDDAIARIHVFDPHGVGITPVFIGGFSFFSDDTWASFGPGELVMPEVSYVRTASRAAWVVTVAVDGDIGLDPAAPIDDIAARLTAVARSSTTTGDLEIDDDDRAKTHDLVSRTIDRVRSGALSKVVLARTVRAEATVDIPRLTQVLVERYPGCVTFAFERNGEWFVGATPELLVRMDGNEMTSAAVGATAPRYEDPERDRIELESLRTAKQLEEQDLVVHAIVDALDRVGVIADVKAQQVMELRRVRHLATEIVGTAPAGVGLLDLVGALHPTPAVGGVPGSGALVWMRDNEPFTRGWYAAPIGIIQLNGSGEFRVALRSARIMDDAVHLYAGAGIVAGSEADAEMDEIDLKLGVMAGAVAAAR